MARGRDIERARDIQKSKNHREREGHRERERHRKSVRELERDCRELYHLNVTNSVLEMPRTLETCLSITRADERDCGRDIGRDVET